MQSKPRYLWSDYASQFMDHSVVYSYQHRPPYPSETFDILLGLITRDYVESFHSMNGFSRQRMSQEKARIFDRELEESLKR